MAGSVAPKSLNPQPAAQIRMPGFRLLILHRYYSNGSWAPHQHHQPSPPTDRRIQQIPSEQGVVLGHYGETGKVKVVFDEQTLKFGAFERS